jgi:adenylate cyclase
MTRDGIGRRETLPAWFPLVVVGTLAANTLASWTTSVTIELMRGTSEFARTVRASDLAVLPYFLLAAFTAPSAIVVVYLWPIVAYFRRGCPEPAPLEVRRRVISAPLVVSLVGFAGWVAGLLVFPPLTVVRFGRWSTELMSQQVLSPLVNGFLAATTSYLFNEWVFRRMVVPRAFHGGRLTDVSCTLALGVQGRLLVFLVAVAFIPLFTLFGLVRAAVVRLDAGMPVAAVVPALAHASEMTFAVFVVVGAGLTILLARTFTGPLAAIAGVVRRVRAGEFDEQVAVTAGDEIGVLEDGVNAMVDTLREKDRILQTFGRVVEPSVRDRLLAGDIEPGGELRTASVLFCDLRGFTALAERTPPAELVATLNEFFTVTTGWVHECGGFVDKFIGDALLVVFGLFSVDGEDAQADGAAAAIRCALGMRERLERLNVARAAAGRPQLAAKIGVHTGQVLAGTIGARDRHQFTVIGDTVNVADRLQRLCRELDCDVVASETTYNLAVARGAVGAAAQSASVALRGRDQPVRVFPLR